MNYLEGLQFADACIQSMMKNKNTDTDNGTSTIVLTKDVMKAILQQQAAVMTVRHGSPIRDEFIASMELTRL